MTETNERRASRRGAADVSLSLSRDTALELVRRYSEELSIAGPHASATLFAPDAVCRDTIAIPATCGRDTVRMSLARSLPGEWREG
jgi:hypothetical protein